MSVLQCGDRLVVSELSRLDRLLGQIIAILDTLAKGERRLRGAEGEHPRRGVRPGPSSAAIPSTTTKTTCRLSAAPAQGGRLPVHAVASAGPTANLARETPSLARGLLERSMNGVWGAMERKVRLATAVSGVSERPELAPSDRFRLDSRSSPWSYRCQVAGSSWRVPPVARPSDHRGTSPRSAPW